MAADLLYGLVPVLSIILLLLWLSGSHITSSCCVVVRVIADAWWTLTQIFLAQLVVAISFHFLPNIIISKLAALERRVHIAHIFRRLHWVPEIGDVNVIFTSNSSRLAKTWGSLQSFRACLFVYDSWVFLHLWVCLKALALGSIPRLLLFSFISFVSNTISSATSLLALRRQHRFWLNLLRL